MKRCATAECSAPATVTLRYSDAGYAAARSLLGAKCFGPTVELCREHAIGLARAGYEQIGGGPIEQATLGEAA